MLIFRVGRDCEDGDQGIGSRARRSTHKRPHRVNLRGIAIVYIESYRGPELSTAAHKNGKALKRPA